MDKTLDEILAGSEREPGQCDGLKITRRYTLADGRVIETIEVPAPLFRHTCGPKEVKRRSDMWLRGQARQIRNMKIKADLGAGVKQEVIAAENGLSQGQVSLLKKKLTPHLVKPRK